MTAYGQSFMWKVQRGELCLKMNQSCKGNFCSIIYFLILTIWCWYAHFNAYTSTVFINGSSSYPLACASQKAEQLLLDINAVKRIANIFRVCTVIMFGEQSILHIAPPIINRDTPGQHYVGSHGYIYSTFRTVSARKGIHVPNYRYYNRTNLPSSTNNTNISVFKVIKFENE